jgi:hypothetical protein
MASFARHVDVEWNGTLMEGNGTAKAAPARSRFRSPFRVESTKPETARRRQRSCSPAPRNLLRDGADQHNRQARRQAAPRSRDRHVAADKERRRHQVVSSNLKAVVEGLEGIDPDGLSELAKSAEKAARSRTRSAATSRFPSTRRLPDRFMPRTSIALLVALLLGGGAAAQSPEGFSSSTSTAASMRAPTSTSSPAGTGWRRIAFPADRRVTAG